MCIGCGGTCGAADDDSAPRFTRHAQAAPLAPAPVIVGTNLAPGQLPDHLVTLQPGGMVTYESLYTTLGPNGEPALTVAPGTFGAYATRAGKGR